MIIVMDRWGCVGACARMCLSLDGRGCLGLGRIRFRIAGGYLGDARHCTNALGMALTGSWAKGLSRGRVRQFFE